MNEYEHHINDKKINIITDKPNMELPSIILKFSEKAIKIEDIHIPQTSLEDVFLDLTGVKRFGKKKLYWVHLLARS